MEVGVKVEGVRELVAALRQAGQRDLIAALTQANEAAAEIVVDSALPDVPFRSGALRRSVQARASAQSGRATAGTAYGAAIHWGRKVGNVGRPPGNRKGRNPIQGRRFLWDAAQREVPKLEPAYRDEILRVVERAVAAAKGG